MKIRYLLLLAAVSCSPADETGGTAEVDRIDLSELSTVTVLESGAMVPKEKMTNETKRTTFMDAISGAAVTGHNSSGKVLTAAEADQYLSREKVLGW
ncbi:MAG: hypothetical protein IJR77_04320 [Bacteroidales bacterium]|nr:hypothetical protein [Bacteroidales bacterium]